MSLKAYNPRWAHHEALRAAATRWHKRGLLAAPQLAAILAAHPLDYYRPNIFLRITLFVFTVIGALTGSSFVALLTNGQLQDSYLGFTGVVCAAGSLLVLEAAIRNSRLYHAGVDNALLYVTLGWLVFLVLYVLYETVPLAYRDSFSLTNPYMAMALLLVLLLLLAATVRYADRLVAAVAYGTYLLLLAAVLLRFPVGRLLLPFAVMLASAAAYYLLETLARRPDYLYYQACLKLVKALALVTFYLGGNYLVVREGNALLSGAFESGQIPLAGLFYVFTAGIPVLYLLVGLRRPDRTWLWVGLLAVGFSIFTLRHYRTVLPPEIAAALAGSALIAAMVFVTRYLRTPRHGLTTAAGEEDGDDQKFNLESLVVAQTTTVPQPTAAGFGFGGGSSGGGGADGSY